MGNFLTQAVVGNVLLGRRPSPEWRARLPSPLLFLQESEKLLRRDFANIEAGRYKMPEELAPPPVRFMMETLKILRDIPGVRKRERDRDVTSISTLPPGHSYPNYYAQTFHFQTDGYLSDESAALYDHQVELVFGGLGDVMRRQLLPFIRDSVQESGKARLEVLDLACGTGRFIRELKRNFRELRVTGVDLSPHYLKKAREDLQGQEHVTFLEAAGEALPFPEGQFDVVTNIFLFHELPERVRAQVAAEVFRVLKPGGRFLFMDSLQLDDDPRLNPSLEFFPQFYFEPYYANYIRRPVESVFREAGFRNPRAELAFLAKIVVVQKPADAAAAVP